MNNIKNIRYYLKKIFLDNNDKDFISHNTNIFSRNIETKGNDKIVLLELNESSPNLISYSYLSSVLAKKYNASVYSFFPRVPRNNFHKFLWWYRSFFGFKTTKLFKSFGSKGLIVPSLNKSMIEETDKIFNEKIHFVKSKDQLENLTIYGIIFGDLVYDYYLNYYKESQIDINSSKFRQHLRYCIKCVVFWKHFMQNNNIKAINVSHTVYTNAIPLRVAIDCGIASFQTNAHDVYRLSNKNYFAYLNFKEYREIFKNLPRSNQIKGMSKAKEKLQSRFSGEVGVDMVYSKKSAYGENLEFRLIRKSPNLKILVAPHCFFDSPHPYGNNLFPDVQEWLKELIDISKKTNYDWYVKTHPDFIQETKDVVDEFFKNIPNFTILPSNASHNQIIEEGINFALTIYGTIGFEYAAQNLPVINASLNNPHIAYDFNINPKSRKEYRSILMSLEDVKHEIHVNDVYEYYYMKHIHPSKNWLFDDYDVMLDYFGGYYGQFTSQVYNYWIERWSKEKHEEILSTLSKFIDSNWYHLERDRILSN